MHFIHTADIHLGATPDSSMPWAKDRPAEIWDSFYRLLDEAESSKTDLLLIAGDMFHRQPLKRELKELDYRFSMLSHTQVVIMAGNHDYIGPNSFYKDFEWSDNVVFFKKDHISYVYLDKLNTFIYGMSYNQTELTDAFYDNIRPMRRFGDGSPIPSDAIHILLAHGGDNKHIPIQFGKLRQAGFDYVALGHIHKGSIFDGSAMAYAGALEPIDRGDIGPHGYIRGLIKDKETSVEFVPFALRAYLNVDIPLDSAITMQSLIDEIKLIMAQKGRQNMYHIRLTGSKPADFELDARSIMRLGRILSLSDESVPDFDYERIYIENKNNIIGMYIQQIISMDIEDSLKSKALFYGMKALYQIK